MYNDLISVFSFFKQKTAYEMRISDWSSDVCSSDLAVHEIWLAEFMGAELFRAVPDFFVDRLKVQQREAGVRHDLIDAVFGLEKRKDEIVGNLARVKALQALMAPRSEERRVGKGCVSTCRSRCSTCHQKKNKSTEH